MPGPPKQYPVKVSTRISREDSAALKACAKRLGVSPAALSRLFLREGLERQLPGAVRVRREVSNVKVAWHEHGNGQGSE